MKLARLMVLVFLTACLAACQPLLARLASTSRGSDASQPKGVQIPWALTYTRSGGFAGLSQTVIIKSDGTVLDEQGQEIPVQADTSSALVAEIDQLDFSSYDTEYGNAADCRDCYTYTLTFEQGDQTTTITIVEDGSSELPAELQSLLQKFDAIAAAS